MQDLFFVDFKDIQVGHRYLVSNGWNSKMESNPMREVEVLALPKPNTNTICKVKFIDTGKEQACTYNAFRYRLKKGF